MSNDQDVARGMGRRLPCCCLGRAHDGQVPSAPDILDEAVEPLGDVGWAPFDGCVA